MFSKSLRGQFQRYLCVNMNSKTSNDVIFSILKFPFTSNEKYPIIYPTNHLRRTNPFNVVKASKILEKESKKQNMQSKKKRKQSNSNNLFLLFKKNLQRKKQANG